MNDEKYLITCKNCNIVKYTNEKRSKFCSRNCAAIFNNKNRESWPDNWRQKISDGLKNFYKNHPEKKRCGIEHVRNIGKSTKGKYKNDIKSILDVSKRTTSKILKRLNIGCCICGWNDASCDIHHINGRKVQNANGHWNLTCICPNHHRMFHNGKIEKEKFVTLDKHIPENWSELYYG